MSKSYSITKNQATSDDQQNQNNNRSAGKSSPAIPVIQNRAQKNQPNSNHTFGPSNESETAPEKPKAFQLKQGSAAAIADTNNNSRAQPAKFEHPIQKKENNTGLPDALKAGVENMSGFSMDDVKVHYNSDKPAQLQAYAYAQGTDIHLAPGQ